jgi:DNA polymerase-4
MPLRALIVDFNSFFASVEQQLRPELRGRPVAVAPVKAETTCAIAASYEAKKFGVKTGTMIAEARRMCPGLVVVTARPPLYVKMHHELKEAIDACMHIESVGSIDEMECDLTGVWRQKEKAIELALTIKRTIAEQVGEHMRCSIGIAPNQLLAKLASDLQKPDGLVVIEEHELPQRLYGRKLQDFSGISHAMEARLRSHGIETVEQMCAASKEEMRAAWEGVTGEWMWRALRGENVRWVHGENRTIGHSHVLAPKLRNDTDARAVLHRLLQKAAMRLRKIRYFAGGLALSVKYLNRERWGEAVNFLESQDTLEFLHVLNQLWERRPKHGGTPLLVGVTLFGLKPEQNVTRPLFGDENREKLHSTVDALNAVLGNNTVYFGGAHTALDSSPMRIAFNRIPDPKTEDDEKPKRQRAKKPAPKIELQPEDYPDEDPGADV